MVILIQFAFLRYRSVKKEIFIYSSKIAGKSLLFIGLLTV